jgi:hypothetical protein
MIDKNFDTWIQAWSRASASIVHPVLGRPDASADRAFELLARARAQGDSASLAAVDPDALAKDCAMLSGLIRNVRPGFVKVVYFTTKGAQLDRVLLGLVFMTVLARLNDYRGPVGWLSFPASLLGAGIVTHITEVFSAIEGVGPELGAPVDWAVEAAEGLVVPQVAVGDSAPGVYIGTEYPFVCDDPDPSPESFEVQYGLPMICIPSRATDGLLVQLSPSPMTLATPA